MSWSSRRAVLVLTAVAGLAGLFLIGHVYGQKLPAVPPIGVPPMPGDPKAPGGPGAGKAATYDLGNLTLPVKEEVAEKIEAAADRIKEKEWKRAAELLQDLVGRSEDVFVPVKRRLPDGSQAVSYVSVKKEAARLISTMPKEGRQTYEAMFAERAKTAYDAAKKNNDFRAMSQVMGLYFYTEYGVDAATWLGTYSLDRAEFQGASRFFSLLMQRDGVQSVKDRTLLKSAYAFHQAGDSASKELAFKELERRNLELKLRGEVVNYTELQASINKLKSAISLQSASDSPVYRGRPTRTAMLPGGAPFLERAWVHKLSGKDQSAEQVRRSVEALQSRNLPVLTSFMPVTATMADGDKKTPLVIYRTYGGIEAANVRNGKRMWVAESDWSLDSILGADERSRDTYKISAYTNWLQHWQQPTVRPQILFDNSVLNTLSADSKLVYAIEDLVVPPPAHVAAGGGAFPGGGIGGGVPQNFGKDVTAAMGHNKLVAYDLNRTGKIAWEIGGSEGPLADSFFLSAPLPINGRLYVLTERQQELRLATLDQNGKVLGLQTLASTKDIKLASDPVRRTQACQLAYAEGILVVPTNAGAVFGVDLMSNSLLWAYPYRQTTATEPNPNPGGPGFPGGFPGRRPPGPGWIIGPGGNWIQITVNEPKWTVTAPAIANGRVVFTAPDESDIHCVNLRDGSRLWSKPRIENDDLYLGGVYSDKVVIVGRKKTRALSLARGDAEWTLETGLPSGQGAAGTPNTAGDIIYYLPIRESISTREPEIVAVNVDKGIIHARTKSRKKEVVGNLLFYEGTMLAQTQTEMVAFPQLEVKLAQLDKEVGATPDDPRKLTERGDYLLDKGDLSAAITDFRKALGNKPDDETKAKARGKLFDAFTELFQRDFAKAEDYIKEYEEMCKVDLGGSTGTARTALEEEGRRRRANFLCLVGKGRESQNRLVEAFEKYLELGAEARKDELIQVVDEPSVKAAPDVWSQGRIASMIRNAKDAKQKKALEDLIVAKWAKLKESKPLNLDELRKFVSLFGSLFDVGKEARFALADRLMEDTDINSLLEAEQQLSVLRGDDKETVAAAAVEALARLNLAKGRLEDAAYYYRLLGERYPKVEVAGKTGSDWLDDLTTDKRFLPYLDTAARSLIKGRVDLRYSDERKYHSNGGLKYHFHHAGEPLPFFGRHSLALELNYNQQLTLTDTTTGEVRWKTRLTPTMFQQIVANQQSMKARFSYQTLGHLVVLQLGHMIFGIDPVGKEGRVLWERNLSSLPPAVGNPPPYTTLDVDPKDNSLRLVYSDGWTQRLGLEGPLQGGVVCLQMRDSITAIDPVTGRTLWTRSDVTSRSRVTGDEHNLYVVNLSENGTASGTRVFRAYDGVSVKAGDFSGWYNNRVTVSGRTILSTQNDAAKGFTVSLYDMLEGKELWSQSYPAGSKLMNTTDDRFAGVFRSDDTVHVLDLVARKEVFTGKLDGGDLGKATGVSLIPDAEQFYFAVNGPTDPNVAMWGGGVQQNVTPGSGLRTLPVNGGVYAFDRASSKKLWSRVVENQHLVVSQFDALPMLLFTSRYQHMGPPPNRMAMQRFAVRAIAKHNGKLWYAARLTEKNYSEKEGVPDDATTWNTGFFHTLNVDARSGKVEFVADQIKVTLSSQAK